MTDEKDILVAPSNIYKETMTLMTTKGSSKV